MKNTSRNRSLLSELKGDGPLSVGTLAYFRQRLRNHLYEMVLNEFIKNESEQKLTKTKIAMRIRRDNPSQITRWLAEPSNLEIDTISDLLLGMGSEPKIEAVPLSDQMARQRNDASHEWLDNDAWQELNQPEKEKISDQVAQGKAQIKIAGLEPKKAENENHSDPQKSDDQGFQTITAFGKK